MSDRTGQYRIAGALAVLLIAAGVVVFTVDSFTARRTLSQAQRIRALAGMVTSFYSDAFRRSGINAVAEESAQNSLVATLKTSPILKGPFLFKKTPALAPACRELTVVLAEPRGNWLTYSQDIAQALRKLDGAIAEADVAVGEAFATEAKATGELDAKKIFTAYYAAKEAAETEAEKQSAVRAEAERSADEKRWGEIGAKRAEDARKRNLAAEPASGSPQPRPTQGIEMRRADGSLVGSSK